MNKNLRPQIFAWSLYFAFLAYYLATLVAPNPFLLEHVALVVNVDLWLLTAFPAILTIGTVVLLRRNFPAMAREMAKLNRTPEDIEAVRKTMHPRLRWTTVLGLCSAAVIATLVYQLGFHWQALTMFGLSLAHHGFQAFLPLKKVDGEYPVL